jgi:hypothetical protein
MSDRRVLLYFSWSRPAETGAPLTVIDDRFPAIFELRRLFYPKFEEMSDPERVDQGIAGFLDHVQKPNFAAFMAQAGTQTGHPVTHAERVADDGSVTLLDDALIAGIDTIVVISFDSLGTRQIAGPAEIGAVRRFLSDPDHVIVVCPHHDIGTTPEPTAQARVARQTADFLHHGDKAIPPQQAFGGFARTLLAGLGVPIENRFGLRPATEADGTPTPIEVERSLDRLALLEGVETFNHHPHLPQLERIEDSATRMDVLARQRIDMAAPPHPFTRGGRQTFDALLQSRREVFSGTLLVSDTTLWSSTAGGVDSLRRLWLNLVQRPPRHEV